MGNYSVRVQKDKSIEKFTEKDWKTLEEAAVKGIYQIIKKHIEGHVMSDKGAKTTVLEYSIAAETPHLYRNKEEKQNIKLYYT